MSRYPLMARQFVFDTIIHSLNVAYNVWVMYMPPSQQNMEHQLANYIMYYVYVTTLDLVWLHMYSPSITVHHIITLYIMMASKRYGFIDQVSTGITITSFSTPLLALSKAYNELGMTCQAYTSFAIFAVCYFLCRIVLFPIYSVIPALLWWWEHLKGTDHSFVQTVATVCLVTLYVIQFVWLKQIIHVMNNRHRKSVVK